MYLTPLALALAGNAGASGGVAPHAHLPRLTPEAVPGSAGVDLIQELSWAAAMHAASVSALRIGH